jgi:DNA-directed RNA polymerase subunit RPC12/RpoP
MACPECGCKVTYQYDPCGDDIYDNSGEFERCANCGKVFEAEDGEDEED